MNKMPPKQQKMDERYYENIVNNMMDVACVIDLENTICFANQAFEKVLGYSPEQVAGLSVFQFVYPDDVEKIIKVFKKTISSVGLRKQQFRAIAYNGETTWLEGIRTPIIDEEGTLAGFIIVCSDITKKMEIEQQLQLTAKVFEFSIEGIVVTDLNGTIQMVNKSFETITGYHAHEAIGKNPRILKSSRHKLDYYEAMWGALKQNGKWQGEFINRRRDGSLYYQSTTIATIKDVNGDPISYCAIFSDITETKEAERKLASDLELARQLQKGVLSKPIKNDHIDIDGVYLPSIQLGGDMYAWYKIDENRYGIILFDIMGHGVASSLICMSIRSLLRGIIQIAVTPDQVLTELNSHMRVLFRENDASLTYFFTAIYVVVDLKQRIIQYASAGHPPGYLIQADRTAKYLDVGCTPIGMLPEINIETEVIPIKGRTQIFLYTDGLSDSFGSDMFQNIKILKELVVSLDNLDSSQLLQAITENVTNNGRRFNDDVTMVAITIL